MIRSGKIDLDPTGTETSDLMCPRCGGSYLHHTGATFYERSEDQPKEIVVKVNHGAVAMSVEATSSSNPSSRRHGMVIFLDCELCSDDNGPIELTIAQHKGNTSLGWRFNVSEK